MNISTDKTQEGADWVSNNPIKTGVYNIMFTEGIAAYPSKKEGSQGVTIGLPGLIYEAMEAENRDELEKTYVAFLIHTKKDGDKNPYGGNQFAFILLYSGLAEEFNAKFAAYPEPFDVPVDELVQWLQIKLPGKRVRYTLEQGINDYTKKPQTEIVHIESVDSDAGTTVDDDLA